jgi:hypothetical protein
MELCATRIDFITEFLEKMFKSNDPKEKKIGLWLLGSMTGLLYLQNVQESLFENSFQSLLTLIVTQFIFYGFLFKEARKHRLPSAFWVFSLGLVLRVFAFSAEPILEDDYYRYLWDGYMVVEGQNPYTYPPADKALDKFHTDYREKINFLHLPTIYPPLAQAFFALNHHLKPHSLLSWKILLLFFDLATFLVFIFVLAKHKEPLGWSFLYFLNPLLIKEVANSAHVDAISMFFFFVAILLLSGTHRAYKTSSSLVSVFSWTSMAFATLIKVFPVSVLPIVVTSDRHWKKGVSIFLLLILAFYLPFLEIGTKSLGSLFTFAKTWRFNGTFFNFFLWLSGNPLIARGVSGFFFLSALFILLKAPLTLSQKVLHSLGILLLLSPVANAWYALWFLPFAALERNVFWLSYTFFIFLGYGWFVYPEHSTLFKISIVGGLALIFILQRLNPLRRSL